MRINNRLLFTLRLMLGAIWLYNGLWLKILAVSPAHQAVVASLNLGNLIEPEHTLRLIGIGETLLAIVIWSGLFNRFISWCQFIILLAMNTIAILFTKAVAQPADLIFQNLPLFFCIIIMAIYGPGLPFTQHKYNAFPDN